MNRVGDTLLHVGANEELVKCLISAGVEFIVVGGLAVAWYCSERRADDMDLLVKPTPENSSRIAGVLNSLRLEGFVHDSFVRPGLQVPIKHVYYAELLTPERGGPTYDELAADAVEGRLFSLPVKVASKTALVKMKLRAAAASERQAEKHRRDIEMLNGHAV